MGRPCTFLHTSVQLNLHWIETLRLVRLRDPDVVLDGKNTQQERSTPAVVTVTVEPLAINNAMFTGPEMALWSFQRADNLQHGSDLEKLT